MKKIFFILFILNCSVAFSQQKKYAVILSRLPIAVGEEKIIARNNLNTIVNALLIQGFEKQNIFYDTATLDRKSVFIQLNNLVYNLKQKDFAFLYVDLPVRIEQDSLVGQRFLLNKINEKEFILVNELENFLMNITLKINDRSLIFSFFDTPKLQFKYTLNALFSGLPEHGRYRGQLDNYEYSPFAKTLAEALTSGSTFLVNYRSLQKAIEPTFAQFAYQEPIMQGYLNDSLFNGQFKRFAAHFEIKSKTDTSTIIINGGESVDILPGTKVKLYQAFTDPSDNQLVAEGKISSVTRYTSVVQLDRPLTLSPDKVWAFVSENGSTLQSVSFNSTFTGSAEDTDKFNELIGLLKKSSVANHIKFVSSGGELSVKELITSRNGWTHITLVNPISGAMIQDFEIKINKDISSLEALVKKYAIYNYLYKIRNDRPELSIDFSIQYPDPKKELQLKNGYPIVYDGDTISCILTNKNPVKVYYAIIDMQPDKVLNPIYPNRSLEIFPRDCFIPANSTVIPTKLDLIISPPFGVERLKIITSLEPIDLDLYAIVEGNISRGPKNGLSFNPETYNTQNFDFEIRNAVFRSTSLLSKYLMLSPKELLTHATDSKISVKLSASTSMATQLFSIENNSKENIYFNLLKQNKDGGFDLLLPNADYTESKCMAVSGKSPSYPLNAELQQYDQFITVYSDRPFKLSNYITGERQLNELVVEIIKSGKIGGSNLQNVALLSALYSQGMGSVTRDGEKVIIRMITPKVSNDRSATVSVELPGFDVNGFATSIDNKPVKSVTINGANVNYDPILKFFDGSVQLSKGKNRIVITATDDKGFSVTEKIDVLFENNTIVGTGRSTNYFLGVGIDNYKTWNTLNNAKYDVTKFSGLLETKFGFAHSDIQLLLDTMATRKTIINSIREFLRKAGPTDNVIIYLSGHGNEDQLADGDYYFIPQEAEADDVTTAIKSSDIIDNFRKINAMHCILIVDACYSGMINNAVPPSQRKLLTPQTGAKPEELPSKWIITSGRATKVSDGDAGKNSPFASVLINYLTEKTIDADLSISKLIQYLKENVPKINPAQNPLGTEIDGLGEYIFKMKKK